MADEATNVVCRYCNKEFTLPGNRRRHERLFHENSHLDACAYCGAVFRAIDAKHLHEKEHLSEGPWPCRHCHKSHRLISGRIRCEDSHEAAGVFVCLLCGESFSSLEDRSRHQNDDHKDARIPRAACDSCGVSFTEEKFVAKHSGRCGVPYIKPNKRRQMELDGEDLPPPRPRHTKKRERTSSSSNHHGGDSQKTSSHHHHNHAMKREDEFSDEWDEIGLDLLAGEDRLVDPQQEHEERMRRRQERSARQRSNSLYAEYVRDLDAVNDLEYDEEEEEEDDEEEDEKEAGNQQKDETEPKVESSVSSSDSKKEKEEVRRDDASQQNETSKEEKKQKKVKKAQLRRRAELLSDDDSFADEDYQRDAAEDEEDDDDELDEAAESDAERPRSLKRSGSTPKYSKNVEALISPPQNGYMKGLNEEDGGGGGREDHRDDDDASTQAIGYGYGYSSHSFSSSGSVHGKRRGRVSRFPPPQGYVPRQHSSSSSPFFTPKREKGAVVIGGSPLPSPISAAASSRVVREQAIELEMRVERRKRSLNLEKALNGVFLSALWETPSM